MSKIVQAVNVMITNPTKITSAVQNQRGEVFFLYNGKYKWSIWKDEEDGDLMLWFYPGDQSLEELAGITDWPDEIKMVTYRSNVIGTKEAKASFSELLTLAKEKVYGLDGVLDDIIEDDVPF